MQHNAADIAAEIITFAKRFAANHLKDISKNNQERPGYMLELTVYYVALLYIIVDRQVTALYKDAAVRDTLLDGVITQLSDLFYEQLAASDETNWNHARKYFFQDVEQLAVHAEQLFPPQGENPKGTLVWEFSQGLVGRFKFNNIIALQVYGGAAGLLGMLLERTGLKIPRNLT